MQTPSSTNPAIVTQASPKRGLIMAAVMAAMFMAALEGTVIGTAMPSIARRFGDLGSYSWVFSAYLLAQTVTSLGFGRFADVAGRRAAIITGLVLFLVGSIACGLAWSMPSLIAFRFLQGMGAGAILPLCMTIVGDLFPPHERGKAQSLIATVFGTSSVLGPVVGGLIVENASWAWVFWINVPIAVAAIAAFRLLLPSHAKENRQPLNLGANLLLAAALLAGLLALSWVSGEHLDWAAIAIAVAVVTGAIFARADARTTTPIFDREIWRQPSIMRANIATLLGAMAIIGLTAFLPFFMQVVLHFSPIMAGLALTAVAIGWPAGATFAGWYQLRIGLDRTMLIGGLLLVSGTGAFATLSAASDFVHAAAGSILMGAGMGLLTSAAMMIVQEAVAPNKRGAVTSANVFSRNLGGVLGTAVFGSIFNYLLRNAGSVRVHDIEAQLSLGKALNLSPAATSQIAAALHWVFLTMGLCAVAALLTTLIARQAAASPPR